MAFVATSCSPSVPPSSSTRVRASSRELAVTSPDRTRSAPASSAKNVPGTVKSRAVSDHVDTAAAMSTRARIYLDWNATAPLVDEARAAMAEAAAEHGNPSSLHFQGPP